MFEKKLLNINTGVITTEGTSENDINCYVREYEEDDKFILEGESVQGHKIYATLTLEEYFMGKCFKDKMIGYE